MNTHCFVWENKFYEAIRYNSNINEKERGNITMFQKKREQRFNIKDLLEKKEERSKFNRQQIKAMKEAFYAGLPILFIKKYCNSMFSKRQLQEIFHGYWLTDEQRNHYATTLYSGRQMEEIRLGYEHHLKAAQVSVFADSRYNARQMEQLRLALEYDYTSEQLSLIRDHKMHWMQMLIIRKGIEDGMSMPYLQLFARKDMNWIQMWQISQAIREGIPYTMITDFSEPNCKWYSMYIYRIHYAHCILSKDIPIFLTKIMND